MSFHHLGIVLLFPFLVGAGSLKLYDDDSKTTFTMVEPMDCSILKTTSHGITLGFKFGAAFIGVGPEVTFGEREQGQWEEAVQGLIVQYKELCARFNTGAISKKGYEARLRELDAVYQKARRELVRGPEERANRMFDRLKEEERAR
jgi:hypothetical protein